MIRLFYIIRIKIKAGLRYRELNDFYIYILTIRMYPRRTFTPVLEVIYEENKKHIRQPTTYEQAIIAQLSYWLRI
jgi:hypothetical protein